MKKILIIDDEIVVRESIRDALKSPEYIFITSVNGKDGIKRIKKDNPILVITDLRMPKMSGLEMLKELQPKPEDPYGIIVLTGHGENEDMEACFNLGVTAFIQKPFNIIELQGTVKQNIALKETQNQLRDQKDELEYLHESIQDTLTMVSATGKFLDVSPNVKELIGFDRDELIGQNISNAMPAKEVPKNLKEIIDVVGGRPADVETCMIHKDGHEISVRIRGQRIKKDGKWIVFGTIRDITERIILENELKGHRDNLQELVEQQVKDIEEKTAQLQHAQKMEAVGQLAGGIAHDFNNILTGVMGYAELGLMLTNDQHSNEGYFNSIIEKAGEGAQVVRQLMAFSRKQALSLVTTDMFSLMKEAITFFRKTIREDIEIEYSKMHNFDGIANVDTIMVKQIISNLLYNAQHAMPQGGKITIDGKSVTLSHKKVSGYKNVTAGEFIEISVNDTGTGMTKETAGKIFDPFFTTKDIGEGTGLGLSMVYGLMEQHGGFVTVESTLNKGSTFYLYFPKSELTIKTEEIKRESLIQAGKGTVLIVEDDLDILSILKVLLHSLSYEVKISNNGKEALNVLKNNGAEVDLVISDVIMPEMGGIELVQKARKEGIGAKFIFISGYASIGQFSKDKHIAEIPYLQKPFTMQAAAKKIKEVLGN